MKILIAGLGKMGSQIALKLQAAGHNVIGYDVDESMASNLKTHGVPCFTVPQDAVNELSQEPCILWLMIPAEYVTSALETWSAILPKHSVIVDGGNTDYRKTKEHANFVQEQGHEFLDVGTSGGVWGLQNGFSMMAGGSRDAYQKIQPMLDTLTKPNGAYDYFGLSGSGHFVKMVHNAIEYGMMQSLAEGYRLLKEGPYNTIDPEKAGTVWQHGSVIASWLNELTVKALAEDKNLSSFDGYVAESGEARWAIETAKDIGIPMPAIEASFGVRLASQKGDVNYATKLLAAMRHAFGGHAKNK